MAHYSQVGPDSYRVLVGGSWVAEVYRGRSGWWLVTNNRTLRFARLRDLEARVAAAAKALA